MEPQLRKVLVVGSTQGVGLEVTKILLKNPGRYEVYALVRNREKAAKVLGDEAAKVNIIDGDITKEETLQPACQGMDAVVCTVGASAGWRVPGLSQVTPKHVDFLGVKKLSEAAASAKVPKFVLVSSLGVTRPWFVVSILLNVFMGRVLVWKFKGENALREAYKKSEHINYYIVRPGGLTNNEGGKHGLIVDQEIQNKRHDLKQEQALLLMQSLQQQLQEIDNLERQSNSHSFLLNEAAGPANGWNSPLGNQGERYIIWDGILKTVLLAQTTGSGLALPRESAIRRPMPFRLIVLKILSTQLSLLLQI